MRVAEGDRPMTVAVLFADPRGCYSKVDGVDLWDESRDARLYAGPWPVVAHPPCARWCRLAPVVQAKHGKRIGDDGGCFESALASVRRWGGVLEHPAISRAWSAHGLARPHSGAWQRGACGGWACQVEQGRYGHKTRKATWLYAFGVDLPDLRWGRSSGLAPVSWDGDVKGGRDIGRATLPRSARSATPDAFRDLLLAMARTAPSARA
jgi:hypothetical protein